MKTREELLAKRNKLMSIVTLEKQEHKQHGIKHLSLTTRLIVDQIWEIDEQIMEFTGLHEIADRI